MRSTPTNVRGPCPVCNHGPRDSALSTKTDERGTVSYCHRCGYKNSSFKQANNTALTGIPIAAKTYRPWRDIAEHLWETSRPLLGSLAASYLARRGCRLPPADADLRFLPAHGEYLDAMLGRVTDAVTCEPISLHFTRLNPDGSKVSDNPKLLLKDHRKAGGVIRLWPNETVTLGLAISEGVESALAAAHEFTPIWSAIDAGNLGAFPVLCGIEVLTIIGDHDEAGLSAAKACAQRWADAGCEVKIARPRMSGLDAADLVVPT
jgi:putative DNA primase/helicase